MRSTGSATREIIAGPWLVTRLSLMESSQAGISPLDTLVS